MFPAYDEALVAQKKELLIIVKRGMQADILQLHETRTPLCFSPFSQSNAPYIVQTDTYYN
jgi:hypothetical protein